MKYGYINTSGKIKRFVAVLLALVTLLAFACPIASAEETAFSVSSAANRQTVSQGNMVIITLLVSDVTVEEGLLSLDIPVQFDETVFELVDVEPVYPSVWDMPEDFSYSSARGGTLWLRILNNNDEDFSSAHGCIEGGTMGFRLILRARSDAPLGESTVNVNGDGDLLVISGAAADGECTVVYGSGEGITLNVAEFSGIIGDVSNDGKVNSLDAAFILRYDADLTVLDETAIRLADVNSDGKVTSLDAAMVLRFDAGLIKGY
ncbi:MAG: dockerin type I repeat-containing protein [Clostridia bacterium]|nr:dockerin type I repeat-containing protein [Clostridia bacterium]